jgi:hypothetical protein
MGLRRVALVAVGSLALSAFASGQRADDRNQKDQKDDRRPRLMLTARPAISIAPSRVVLTAEVLGGANDFEEFYCPTVTWEWGDGTTSETTSDCEPYESGKSEIKRRFTVVHVFRAGNYRVTFRLKRQDKSIASATTSVQVRPGLRDIGE